MGALADDVEFAFEGLVVRAARAALNKGLAHEGLALDGRTPQRRVVRGDVAPAEHLLAFLGHDSLKNLCTGFTHLGIGRGIDHGHAVLSRLWQHDLERLGHLFQEAVWHLHQNARAVARIHFAAAGSAMVQIHQNRQRLLDDFMRAFAFHLTHEPDATSVVFELRVIKALFLW